MDELLEQLIDIFSDINEGIEQVNDNLEDIKDTLNAISNYGTKSLDDVCDKIDELKGGGVNNSIADVCDKLDAIDNSLGWVHLKNI